MKAIRIYPLLILALLWVSCRKEEPQAALPSEKSKVEITNSLDAYNRALQNRSAQNSDPFVLDTLYIDGDSLKITLSYSGGCARHSFKIIWNELITSSNPPSVDLLLLHDAHGDMCEAMITETLAFALSELNGIALPNGVSVGVSSGYTPSDSLVWVSPPNEVVFTEGDLCNTLVTAEMVLCGTGLFDNLWFALDSSEGSPDSDGFHSYLRPVAVAEGLSSFRPVAGKRYRMGARIVSGDSFNDQITCLAWPGPSETVIITCIEEVE